VHRQLPDVRFLLVGPRQSEGPFAVDQADVEQHAPYVTALGARSDVPALLRLAHVFAFPTEYREGIPRVLLEAGLAGVPIVTTTMPGCTDVVRDGWNGYCVPARDPPALAERLLRVLRAPDAAASMGRRSSEFVRKTFGLGGVGRQYAGLYTQILDARRGRLTHGSSIAPQPSTV
jgi:glycosyltransferase involved in cell wall biosynthesis